MSALLGIGTGAPGLAGEPSAYRTTPERCPELGHPGATYNAAMDMTWCLCGAEITDGDTAVPHVACCGGPLTETTAHRPEESPDEHEA